MFKRTMFTLAAIFLAMPAHAQVTPELIDAAKKEGKVVWYTTVADGPKVLQPLASLFAEKYGVTIEYATGSTTDNASKIINEARSGSLQSDLWDGSTTYTTIKAAGLDETYLPASAQDLPDDFKDPEGRWLATSVQYYGAVANTELLPPENLPKTYEDLLVPDLKGQLALERRGRDDQSCRPGWGAGEGLG